MPADREKLRAAVEELHNELASVEDVDADMQQLLKDAMADIDKALQDQSAKRDDDGNLADRLSEAAQHFEDSHPTLTGIIGSVIDTLSRMGI